MIYSLNEQRVEARGNYYVAAGAAVIGSVVLGRDVSVWFNAVVRGDNDVITIGDGTNIQDGAVLHVDPGFPLDIGSHVTVGHQAMLHGCTIGDRSLVGIQAVVLNGAVIGEDCVIGAKTFIPENREIPPRSLVVGSPGRVVRTLDDDALEALKQAASHYVHRIGVYRDGLAVQDPQP